MGYFEFIRSNIAWLLAGFILALNSSFGQTFFISIFAGKIQSDFSLSHGDWGSIYMIMICLLPQFLIVSANVPFYLGGTSLLIAVVVVMDFMAQVQSHLLSSQYQSLMKKANLKGFKR